MDHRLEIHQLCSRGIGPLDLALQAGECVAISGPSGAGKSLMLRAIADLDPHSGSVRLDGEDCGAFTGHDWRRQVGLLPAEPQWWADTIGEHFAAHEQEWLQRLGFSAEVMGWEVARCSTGERQRLGLLRLLQNRPRVLLLDEPTASLDTENTAQVEALVADYRREQGAAVIWVSHNPAQVARVAGRAYRMADGQLQAVNS